MAVDFSGTWTLADSDNFDAYMDALGIPAERREKMLSGDSPQIVDQSGDAFKMTYPNSNITVDFAVGQEKERPLPNGVKIKRTPKWEGNKLVSYDHTEDGRKHKMTWEIVGEQLVKTFEYEGVTAVKKYKK